MHLCVCVCVSAHTANRMLFYYQDLKMFARRMKMANCT